MVEHEKRQRKTRGRSKGEGTVFERKSDTVRRNKPWVAEITLPNGKQQTVGYYKTEAEAIAARNKALRDLEQGTWVANSKQTVAEYLDYWLEHVHRSQVEFTTYLDYRAMLDIHINPTLGHVQLQKLTMKQVQMFCSKLQERLSPGRVKNTHALLHAAIEHSVKEGLVARNVAEGVQLPRLESKERAVLTLEQADQLLAASSEQLKMILTIAVTTGMRRGEILSLKWLDIDLERRFLQVRRNLVVIRGQGFHEKGPKTAHGRRKITLPHFVVELLKVHKAEQEKMKLADRSGWIEKGLVFCSEHGDYFYPWRLDRAFKKLLVVAKLPYMRFHDLRHSAFTILLAMGVPAKVVQEIAGHSHISTTLGTYGHVIPGMHEEAMEIWDHRLGNSGGDQQEALQSQWSCYNAVSQAWLEMLMKRYGIEAAQLAMNAIKALRDL